MKKLNPVSFRNQCSSIGIKKKKKKTFIAQAKINLIIWKTEKYSLFSDTGAQIVRVPVGMLVFKDTGACCDV